VLKKEEETGTGSVEKENGSGKPKRNGFGLLDVNTVNTISD
jgi:hypothetical protein